MLDGLSVQNNGVPIYVQLREQILALIGRGVLKPGAQLPTMRQVAVALKIDLNTVQRAYAELERDGVLTKQRGVRHLRHRGAAAAQCARSRRRNSPPASPPRPRRRASRWTNWPRRWRGWRSGRMKRICSRRSSSRWSFWGSLSQSGAQDAASDTGRAASVWNQPAPRVVSRAAAIDSLGLTAAIRAARQNSSNDHPTVSPTEVHMNPISALVFIVFIGGAVLARLADMPIAVTIVLALIGIFLGYSVKMAQQWERAVVLRLGKLHAVKGPGLFILVPIFDAVATWIDQRIRTTEVNAEQALTKDTVPVNVDAIVFWMVHDAERAALEIADYNSAVQRVAQTSLREMIGSSVLSELLSDRKAADAALKEVIGAKTAEWGVTVNSVEIRDVAIPDNLQDAMSRQAQAEREKQARVILGSAEEEVAQKFVNAAKLYATSPEALQLRAMNIIYETTKERGATILMPTSMVDAMNPGAAAFALNMAKTDAGNRHRAVPRTPRCRKCRRASFRAAKAVLCAMRKGGSADVGAGSQDDDSVGLALALGGAFVARLGQACIA